MTPEVPSENLCENPLTHFTPGVVSEFGEPGGKALENRYEEENYYRGNFSNALITLHNNHVGILIVLKLAYRTHRFSYCSIQVSLCCAW